MRPAVDDNFTELLHVRQFYFVLIYQCKMTQCNTLNVKLSNSQLNELKSGIKSGTEVTLKLSSNVAGDSNDETNFPHRLLLTNTQALRLLKGIGKTIKNYAK